QGSTSLSKSSGLPLSSEDFSSSATILPPTSLIPATFSASESTFCFSSPSGRRTASITTGVPGAIAVVGSVSPPPPPPQPADANPSTESVARSVGSRAFIGRRMLALSLDRDGLRQVARLVDVQPAGPGDFVGEELQRQDRDDRLQDPVGARNDDALVGDLS